LSERFSFLAQLFAGAAVTVALAGCGGGSITGPPPAPIGSAAPLPSPSPTGTPNQHPSTSGDAFAYAGTLTQTFTRFGTPAPQPTTGATPQATSTPWVTTVTQNVAQAVSVTNGATFGGQSNLTDFTTKETDTGVRSSVSDTSDAYVAYVPDATRKNGVDVTLAGTSWLDSNGNSLQAIDAAGNGLIDAMPEAPNAKWTDSAARTETERDATGETSSTTFAAVGSYKAQLTFPEGGTASVQTNPDGSGDYQFPLFGNNNTTISVNAPANGQITGVATIESTLPGLEVFQLNDWYPSTPPVLASDTYQNDGPVSLPAGCNVSSSLAGVAVTKIVETKVRLDVVMGELETQTATSYLSSPDGLLCSVVHDDMKAYYDYSGQTPSLIALSDVPIQDTVTDETLALQTATIASSSARSKRSASATVLNAPLNAVALTGRVRALVAQAHLAHARAFYQASRTRKSP
jgi:hypothetical protein